MYKLVTNESLDQRDAIRAWCRENLGENLGDSINDDTVQWMTTVVKLGDTSPFSTSPPDYRVAVATKTPEHHALVRLTWG